MPRNIDGTYSLPPGSTVVPGTTITASRENTVTADIANDLNYPRPISAGGTGATTAEGAAQALGLTSAMEDATNDAFFLASAL